MSSTHFNIYSAYYDLLYRDKDYAREAGFVMELLGAHGAGGPLTSGSGAEGRSLLDLGCGTGVHDRNFARAGYKVHGIDLSDSMLDRARAEAASDPAIKDRLSYAQGDIRAFKAPGPFDAVVSLFDVVSYVTSNDDLRKALACIRAQLKPGGVFVFDSWYGPAVYTQQPGVRVRRLENDVIKVTRISEPVVHATRNVVDVNFDVFVEEKSTGKISQFAETHPMRCYFDAELDELMTEAGFERKFSGQWYTRQPPTSESWSVLFAYAAKP